MSTRWNGAYPKVDVQIPAAPEFPISDLERHCHFVVFVEFLMETFSRVGAHLDVVGEGGPDEGSQEGAP